MRDFRFACKVFAVRSRSSFATCCQTHLRAREVATVDLLTDGRPR
jgi:hypothetical protein